MPTVPFHSIKHYRSVHREETNDNFGMNSNQGFQPIDGFEIYSSNGRKKELGPMRNDFFRVGLCLKGNANLTVDLGAYTHGANTICFSKPGQIFSICNVTENVSGYYLLFTEEFIHEVIEREKLYTDFPFFSDSGIPFFTLSQKTSSALVALFKAMNKELKSSTSSKIFMIKLLLAEMLVLAKRDYESSTENFAVPQKENNHLFKQYKQLVQKNFLEKRTVADYAEALYVTPNHLNRVIKQTSGKPASHFIKEMLLLEGKVLLRHSNLSISEIAWQLKFNDPSHFVNFFKKQAAQTPMQYRNAESLQLSA